MAQTSKAADAGRETLSAATQNAQRFTDQVTQIFGLAGARNEDLTRRSSQSLEAVAEASAIVTRGTQDLSREWVTLLQEQVQRNIDGFNALARCRSVPELFSVQAELVRDSVQQTVEGTRRMAEVSRRLVSEASQALTAQTSSSQRAA